ncbi:MAG: type II toxin-antitoxin system PemK/MazF family toxin [Bacteroidetes bacterium]|nr:type II toxin-antitoxin system PemK/MazF family toxin [Bacteroidota bacterium]
MILGRGEVWLADLDPVRGSEQAGIRPVILFQNDLISKYSSTVISIPLTTNLNRLSLPSSVLIPSNESDLSKDSVVLCHQMRVLDRERLIKKISNINRKTLKSIEKAVLLTLGY